MPEFNKTALVLGAGGFIGSHMVKHLVSEGYWVRGVDLKSPDFSKTAPHEFIHGDLTDRSFVKRVLEYKGPYRNFYNEIPYKHLPESNPYKHGIKEKNIAFYVRFHIIFIYI